MKTVVLTAALVVLTIATFAQKESPVKSNDFVLNTDEISIAFYPNSTDAVTMILTKDNDQKVKVRVSNSDEKVLYERRYARINRTKVKYDVSEFPSGEYTFEVIKNNEVIFSKNFTKREGTIALVN